VQVGDVVVEATRAVVLATGTDASVPPVDGLRDVPYWTNREAIEAKELPRSLLVLGGGAIGLELGQVFARFGVAVTVVEAMDRLLAAEEPEAGALVTDVLRREGVSVHTSAEVAKVTRQGSSIAIDVGQGAPLAAEQLLVATGRKADVAGLGVGAIGLDESARWVPVDDHQRVAPGVWAVGDVTGKGAFTHVAMYQAGIAVADILGREVAPARYDALPRVTFTDPEVGAVGITEDAARERRLEVRTGMAQVPSSARGWIHKAGNDGFVKLVEDAARGVLVGATSAGPAGGEVLGLLTLAVHAQVPTERLQQMIYAYPTFHRAVEDALRDLTRG
jgi:pyruvate/2-oxoglutarate dehydrogenase complex dihydrolipoamide dehydrogenase (E3) component